MKNYPDVPLYKDFRVMLDKHDKEIDAVVIATPDHTHHYIAKTCLMRGKHVYVEKPMAHSIREVRDLMAAEKKTGLVCQMGNQGHSGIEIEPPASGSTIGHMTVLHNGSPIHQRVAMEIGRRDKVGIRLQDHNNAIQFRNIWVMESR